MRTLPILLLVLALPVLTAQGEGRPAESVDWPQWRGPDRDGVWRETGITETLPDTLTPRWTAPIGSGYSSPTVAAGRVFVMDRVAGDDADAKEMERVHCFAWDTGKSVWSFDYEAAYGRVGYKAGPRCSVIVDGDRAFSLGTVGHLHCFAAATGEVLWSKDLHALYKIRMPIWGIAATPILEGGLLIVPVSGTSAYLVAFDPKTGKEVWKGLDDRGNYSAPIVIDQAGQRVLACWTGDRVVGVAPATGKVLWEHPFKASRMPLGVASPVLAKGHLYFSGFYDGSLLLKLHADELAVTEVWRARGRNERQTKALHSIISTPLIRGDHIYGVDSYGEFRCLELMTGKRIWEDTTAVPRARWATIHFVQNGDRTWMFNERGELIVARLSPEGFEEIDRAALLEPTVDQLDRRGKGVCWSHPAFAYGHVFVRNDEELRCVDLRAKSATSPGKRRRAP